MPFLDADRAIIADCRQGHRFGTRLSNVAALRHARHHDSGVALRNRAPVNMSERPIAEAGALQVGHIAGCVKVMPLRAAQTGVQQPDIDGTFDGWLEAGEEAIGCVGLRKADAVNGDGLSTVAVLNRHSRGTAAKSHNRIGEGQLPGDP
jgi:hypothetical protein